MSFLRALSRTLTILLVLGLSPCATTPPPPLLMGFQAQLGYDPATRFGPLLDHIGNETGRTVRPVAFASNSDLLAASVAQQLDFVYSGPVMFACLQLAGPGIKAMNELVSLDVEDNATAVEPLAGAIVGRVGTRVATASDLAGKIVLAGNIANLASFQAQWRALEGPSFSLFRDARGVFFSSSPLTIVGDVLRGIGDVAFVEGSTLPAAHLRSPAFDDLEVKLQQPPSPLYPYPRSTPLYAYSLISAQNRVSFRDRASLSLAVLSLPPLSPEGAPTAGNFYSWTTSGDYGTVRSVLTAQQFIDPATNMCKIDAKASDLVSCPAGFRVQGDPDTACARRGIVCPPGYTCVCSPCVRILFVGGMRVWQFALFVVGLVLAALLTLFVAVRLALLHVRTVPYRELRIDAGARMGTGAHGLVLGGTWQGQAVAVKRAYVRGDSPPSPFDVVPRRGRSPLAARCCVLFRRSTEAVREVFWLPAPFRSRVRTVARMAEHRHPNILQVTCICLGIHREEVLVVTPRMATGTVGDLIANACVDLTPALVADIACGVAQAMAYLHARPAPVIGKNLKPHHVLLDAAWRPYLGVSLRPPNTESIWAPPEVLRGGPWTRAADVFSFSMLLYMLLTRRPPADDMEGEKRVAAMREATDVLVDDTRPALTGTGPLHELVHLCWNDDPLVRPTFEEIVTRIQLLASDDPPIRRASSSHEGASVGESGDADLLNRVFPEHVVKQLRQKLPVDPESFPEVTIFFSDIVGFTAITSLMPPEDVLDMLHRLYAKMDALAEEHGIYKVETIGDRYECRCKSRPVRSEPTLTIPCARSWMGVTNLRTRQLDHGVRMGRFARAAVDAANKTKINQQPGSPMIHMRCGVHTGPVVAGVMGSSRPRYCLFGKTVRHTGPPLAFRIACHSSPSTCAADAGQHRVAHGIDGRGQQDPAQPDGGRDDGGRP